MGKRGRKPALKRFRMCPVDGRTFVVPKYDKRTCSRECGQRMRHPDSRRYVCRDCERCGGRFLRALDGKDDGRYCGRACSASANGDARRGTVLVFRFIQPPALVDCLHCGAPFPSTHGRQTCSMRCSAQRRIDRSGARINDLYRMATDSGLVATGEAHGWRDVLVGYLRGRDGDRCGICLGHHGPIRWGMRSGPRGDASGLGPSIDHVLPRSHGGTDDVDNLRLTHWRCNYERKNNDALVAHYVRPQRTATHALFAV